MIREFEALGVSVQDIENKTEKKIQELSEDDIKELIKWYKQLKKKSE